MIRLAAVALLLLLSTSAHASGVDATFGMGHNITLATVGVRPGAPWWRLYAGGLSVAESYTVTHHEPFYHWQERKERRANRTIVGADLLLETDRDVGRAFQRFGLGLALLDAPMPPNGTPWQFHLLVEMGQTFAPGWTLTWGWQHFSNGKGVCQTLVRNDTCLSRYSNGGIDLVAFTLSWRP